MSVESDSHDTYLNIILTAASLGPADHTFAILRGGQGDVSWGYVPRKDIILDGQEVKPELTAKLKVKVIKSGDKWDLAEVEIKPGIILPLRIDKETHELLPIGTEPIYHE
ncbi:MAG: hypothetical protein ABSC49_03710 [Candidatus Microgenomates bacterium]|jgi:hypothetical protein